MIGAVGGLGEGSGPRVGDERPVPNLHREPSRMAGMPSQSSAHPFHMSEKHRLHFGWIREIGSKGLLVPDRLRDPVSHHRAVVSPVGEIVKAGRRITEYQS